MTELLIHKFAGVGCGKKVARMSWLRTLADIRSL